MHESLHIVKVVLAATDLEHRSPDRIRTEIAHDHCNIQCFRARGILACIPIREVTLQFREPDESMDCVSVVIAAESHQAFTSFVTCLGAWYTYVVMKWYSSCKMSRSTLSVGELSRSCKMVVRQLFQSSLVGGWLGRDSVANAAKHCVDWSQDIFTWLRPASSPQNDFSSNSATRRYSCHSWRRTEAA